MTGKDWMPRNVKVRKASWVISCLTRFLLYVWIRCKNAKSCKTLFVFEESFLPLQHLDIKIHLENGISGPNWGVFFFDIPETYWWRNPKKTFCIQCIIIMTREGCSSFGILILIGIGMPVLVKVKGYTRVRRGKVEKVRSHYRRVWTAR